MLDPEERKKEQEPKTYQFTEVYLGHPLRGFDRDQLVALYLARLAGLVSPTAPIHFVPRIPDEALRSPTTLNIEGFSLDRTTPDDIREANKPHSNNFTNSKEVKQRLLWCSYDRETNEFFDRPYRRKK